MPRSVRRAAASATNRTGAPACRAVSFRLRAPDAHLPPTLFPAAAKAKGNALKVHFKNIMEVAAALRTTDGKRMSVSRAMAYLENVLEHKEAIPFNTNKGGRGRHAQVRFVVLSCCEGGAVSSFCFVRHLRISP